MSWRPGPRLTPERSMAAKKKTKAKKASAPSETPERPGRPSKLTQELVDKIVPIIRQGNYIDVAAASAGVSKDTFYTWLRLGARVNAGEMPARGTGKAGAYTRAELALFAALDSGVHQAVAEGQVFDMDRIDRAADAGVWQAAAWRLERRFPELYARRAEVVVRDRRQAATELSGLLGLAMDDLPE